MANLPSRTSIKVYNQGALMRPSNSTQAHLPPPPSHTWRPHVRRAVHFISFRKARTVGCRRPSTRLYCSSGRPDGDVAKRHPAAVVARRGVAHESHPVLAVVRDNAAQLPRYRAAAPPRRWPAAGRAAGATGSAPPHSRSSCTRPSRWQAPLRHAPPATTASRPTASRPRCPRRRAAGAGKSAATATARSCSPPAPPAALAGTAPRPLTHAQQR